MHFTSRTSSEPLEAHREMVCCECEISSQAQALDTLSTEDGTIWNVLEPLEGRA